MLRNKLNGGWFLVGIERKCKKDYLGVVEKFVQTKGRGGVWDLGA